MMKSRAFLIRLIELRWAAALLLYGISLALPGVHLSDGSKEDGWVILVMGFFRGFLLPEFAWLANPLFVIGLILLIGGSDRVAGVFGLSALALGSLSFRVKIWYGNYVEGSGFAEVDALGAGFYVWMAAFAILASCVVPWRSRAVDQKGPPTAQ